MATRAQLGVFLSEQGIAGQTLLADDLYACPSDRWITGVFPGEFQRFKASIAQGVSLEWRADVFDCDDQARMAASYAALLHRATRNRPQNAALAFGEFWYEASFGGHAINVAIVAGPDRRPRLMFFEPQNCSIVKLSKSEVQSCYAVRF